MLATVLDSLLYDMKFMEEKDQLLVGSRQGVVLDLKIWFLSTRKFLIQVKKPIWHFWGSITAYLGVDICLGRRDFRGAKSDYLNIKDFLYRASKETAPKENITNKHPWSLLSLSWCSFVLVVPWRRPVQSSRTLAQNCLTWKNLLERAKSIIRPIC